LILFCPDETFEAFPFTQFTGDHRHRSSHSAPEAPTDIRPINEFAQLLLINLLKSRSSKSWCPLCANPQVQHRTTVASIAEGADVKQDHHIFSNLFRR
jgi:hypothetical protein